MSEREETLSLDRVTLTPVEDARYEDTTQTVVTPCPEPDCRAPMERTADAASVRFHCPVCQMSWSEAEVIDLAAADEAPCSMVTEKPYDFAWCETHDETFPLGGICPFHPKAPKDGAP